MNISNINQIFNQKLQDINSRLPSKVTINNKFQTLLEETQLKNSSTTSSEKTSTPTTDINSLLKTMMSTQSLLNTFSSDTSESPSGLFPTSTLNNSINMIQQTQLLNALKKNSKTSEN